MKPGKVSLEIPDDYPLVSVAQDDDCFYGTLRASSDEQYSVVFCDGYSENRNNVRKWIVGKVCLIEEKDTLLRIKDVERPVNAAVSDADRTMLLHTANRESPMTLPPREFVDLGGTLAILERSGEEIFSNKFGSNIFACAISQEGELVSVATLAPDDSIYYFHALEKRLLWKYKNHARNRVLGLAFNGTQIDVFVGKTLAIKEKEYSLSTDGRLMPEYQKKNKGSIKKQPAQQKVESLIARLRTDDTRDVMSALGELKSFVSTKGSITHYGIILDALRAHLQAEKEEVFDAVWKVLQLILKKKPAMVDPFVPEILALRSRPDEGVEGTLTILGELGSANPAWFKDEQSFIMEKLMKSKSWNERRFAAFAMGSIGSSEPAFAKDAIPVMIEYAAHPERVAKVLENLARTDPAVWLQDACIDALGMIGEKSPESVDSAIPLRESHSKEAPLPYTRRKAVHALDVIRRRKR